MSSTNQAKNREFDYIFKAHENAKWAFMREIVESEHSIRRLYRSTEHPDILKRVNYKADSAWVMTVAYHVKGCAELCDANGVPNWVPTMHKGHKLRDMLALLSLAIA